MIEWLLVFLLCLAVGLALLSPLLDLDRRLLNHEWALNKDENQNGNANKGEQC